MTMIRFENESIKKAVDHISKTISAWSDGDYIPDDFILGEIENAMDSLKMEIKSYDDEVHDP